MSRLVSVIIPCFNSARTIELALASLLAQTHAQWECVLVDDGSTDQTAELASRIGDPRIRVIRHSSNLGRAQARQTGLQAARGDYLCMLDSDDWILPTKLEEQLACLRGYPEIALVSSPMFLLSAQEELVGVERFGALDSLRLFPPLSGPQGLPIPHAPSMLRMSVARTSRYDSRLRLAEDYDFLLPILLRHPFALQARPTYVYRYEQSKTLGKILHQVRASRLTLRKFLFSHPVGAMRALGRTYAQELYYRGVFAFGHADEIQGRTSSPATADDHDRFQIARAQVLSRLRKPRP